MNSKKAAVVVEEDEHVLTALNLVKGIVLPMVLKSALELKLFDVMAAAGEEAWLSPSDIAGQLPTKNPDAPGVLDRMLAYLACFDVVRCKLQAAEEDGEEEADPEKKLYGLTPVSKMFTENEGQVSLVPLFMLAQDNVWVDSWNQLTGCVLEGGSPFIRAHGMPVYKYFQQEERMNNIFNRAMFTQTTLVMRKIVDVYKGFDNISVLVDVGGGIGATLSIITSKYPNIKGVNFDLPRTVKTAPACPGVEHVAGDMFEGVPRGNAILLKWILHNWSDENCIKILKNCKQALPDNGIVIVVETFLPDVPNTTLTSKSAYRLHLGMLVNISGKERTWQQYKALAQKSGFSRCEAVCSAYGFSVIEFHNKSGA